MAQDIKIRSRIATLKSLNSIFSALQVITVTKLSKARGRLNAALKFRDELLEAIQSVGPYFHDKTKIGGATAAVLVSGNRGLCGTFNQDVFNRAQSFISEHKDEDIRFFVFGHRGYEFLKSKKQNIREFYLSDTADIESVKTLAAQLWQSFGNGTFSGVYLINNHFYTHFNRRAVANRILPQEVEVDLMADGMIITEPDLIMLKKNLSFSYFMATLFFARSESQLGELSARMVTLKSAIDNSKELIDDLIIQRNKARQQMITQEILEIVETSEALKGEG